jgi:hypothetical protein
LKFSTRNYDQDWFRLIPSRFPIIDVYERLGSDDLRASAKLLEEQTNPRLAAIANAPETVRTAGEGHQFQNWNHAPFVYKNPEGTWFVGPSYGALEVAGAQRAALGLALLRREVFLSRTDEAPMDLEMRMLSIRVKAELVDLTSLEGNLTQGERWVIGEKLCNDGAAGVVFCRQNFSNEHFLAVFDGRVLGRSIQGAHYKFIWDGELIKSIYDFTDGTEILRSELLIAGVTRSSPVPA